MVKQTYVYVDKKKNHKYVQAMFNTPVITHKVIMNKFNGEEIALAQTRNNNKWFVVYLSGDSASEFGNNEFDARKKFMEYRKSR